MCIHHGYPLEPLPGGNVFFTDQDLSTPELPDGSRLISCRQLDSVDEARDAWRGLQLLRRFVLP